MLFIKVVDGIAEQFTFDQFKREHPEKSYPKNYFAISSDNDLAAYGIHRAVELDRIANPNEFLYNVVRKSPELIDGRWTIGWESVEKTEAEKIAYSQANANWDAFHFGAKDIPGFLGWWSSAKNSITQDGYYFEILRGALISRNLEGMQNSYSVMSLGAKPVKTTRLGMQNLAETCNLYVDFLIEGDQS